MNPEEVQALIDKSLQAQQEELAFYRKYLSDKVVFPRNIKINDGRNIQTGRINGTKVGTAIDQLIGFYGVTPVVQQDNSATAGAFSAESGTAVLAGSTFSGYTIGEIVTILQTLGFIA